MKLISSDFSQTIIAHPQYQVFLEHAIPSFLRVLQDGEAQFIQEQHTNQMRKHILEMIHRLPSNDLLRPHVRSILSLMFKLLEKENEENVLICLRIVIELHKQYRPPFSAEVSVHLPGCFEA